MIPMVTVIGTLFLKGVSIGGVFLLDQKQLILARFPLPALRRSSPAGGLPKERRCMLFVSLVVLSILSAGR